jgi:hypothetical protein
MLYPLSYGGGDGGQTLNRQLSAAQRTSDDCALQ